MLIVARDARQVRQFRDAVYEDGDRVSEISLDIMECDRRVFHRIMQ